MSPPWRDQVRIALTPERVVLVRLRRTLRRRVVDKRIFPCATPDIPGAAPWKSACDALDEALKDAGRTKGEAMVVLSNHWTRYQLVPWSMDVREREKAAYVRHHFVQAYGERALDWELRWSEEAPGSPGVASGVDAALLARLRESFRAGRLRLRSVQPYLMVAANRSRPWLQRGRGWLVVAEPGRLCCGAFRQGRWLHLRSVRVGAEWLDELPSLLEREALVCGGGSLREILLYAPERPSGPEAPGAGWTLRAMRLAPVSGFAPLADAGVAMAM